MAERLQKILARAGLASRRASEEIILAGRVRVNGRVVRELGAKADPRTDKIEVDGRRLVADAPVYLVLHKPRNVVSTLSDPQGRPTVAELVRDVGTRVYPVGRLDFATSGVLLFTNDGELANALLHPKGSVPKTYVLKVRGVVSDEDLEPWRRGMDLEDGRTLPAEAVVLRHEDDKTWLQVTIREGRKQQIRRMGEASGWPVMRLARTSFAGITSEGLLPGQWRHLTAEELLALRKEHGVPRRIRSAVGAAPRTAAPRGALVPRGGAAPIELRRGRTRATSDRPPRRAEPSSTRAPRHAEPSAPRSSRHAEPSPSDRPPRRAEPMPPGRPPRRRGAARR